MYCVVMSYLALVDVCRTLDYVFVSDSVVVRDAFTFPRITAPSTVRSLSDDHGEVKHEDRREAADEDSWKSLEVSCPQPSRMWPSDHLMVIADVSLDIN